MVSSQTFEILSRAGGIRAARIITDAMPKMSAWRARRIARKLRRGMPVAKIIHNKWFFGMAFYTSRATLDPRPDTETLVSAVIADCGAGTAPNILDLGTGTGCIIAALVKNIDGAHGVAVDRSWRALRVARRNICTHNLTSRIAVRHGNFMRANAIRTRFDIIVSNPPYIARGDDRVNDGATFDPDAALYAAENGYAAYAAIAKNALQWIKKSGKAYLEIGDGMAPQVIRIFKDAGWEFVRAESDLGGIERVLIFAAPAQ